MRKIFCCLVLVLLFHVSFSQLSVDSIKVSDAASIITYLASDSLKGRGNYTSEQKIAADFIADRFHRAGLKKLASLSSYFQPFYTKDHDATHRDGTPISRNSLLNVIGILDGKSKPQEAIIFCAHYDHVGKVEGEIYNGANDNASGTTALLLLADYYARRANNERTIIFCAFAGEELGLFGSKAFAPLINANAVVAVINIEMIGISQLGKNAFSIIGAQHSDFKKIFEKNLAGKFKIKNEPDLRKELFSRSDNFPFAKRGIPAHTIMASDDDDVCYHKPCDDANMLDVGNMTNLIRAIAIGSESIINGTDTPTRIKIDNL